MRRALRSTVLLTCVVWATLLGRTSFTCLQHRVYSEWLRSKGAAVPPENWLVGRPDVVLVDFRDAM
eukprot:symbB.v1.2.020513.t1/scaffold1680.1/size106110/1